MLILHIIADLGTGGAELMMKRLIESHLDAREFEHRVISLRGLGTVGPTLQEQGVPVDALGLVSAADLPATILRLARRIRALRPDVVQTWMYHADLLGGLAARLAGCRCILWGVRITNIGRYMGAPRRTLWIRRVCAWLSPLIPAKILYVAKSACRVHEQLGYDASKSIVIPNGYLLPPYAGPNSDSSRIRAELGLTLSHLLVGSAGRFSPQKDYHTFIRACTRVAEQLPDAHFVIAGREIDPSNDELVGWIEESGYANRFYMIGERPDLAECLAGMNIFCLHSVEEGLPNVVAEAMAVGLPCVVTDVGDAAALVDGTGAVVPPSNPEAIATAMVSMLRKSPGELHELGKRARLRIAEHFSMDAIRLRYEQLYRELAGECPQLP